MGTSGARYLALATLGTCVACNVFSGAEDLSIGPDGNDNESIDGVGASDGGSGAGDSTGPGADVTLVAVDGVTLTAIEIYQGVRRPLMENGIEASSDVPIVAGRDATLRLFYALQPDYNGQPVIARATLGDDVVEVEATVAGTSSVGDLNSTVNIDIAGELMTATSYKVELLHPEGVSSGNNTAATFPAVGQQTLPLQNAGNQVRLTLVPISYGADNSNRLPDTSPEQLERYRRAFWSNYPVPNVEITVLQPVQWNNTLSANGSGWGQLLDAMSSFRQQNSAAPDEYYYAIIAPAQSMSAFCGGGCVAGLSLLAIDPNDAFARVGIGLGFTGEGSADTAIHEVGHQHGRGHAPCDTSNGLDPNFPNSNGSLGDWGMDLSSGALVSPSTADFMSYCDPTFVSPYTFRELFDRIRHVNGAASLQFSPEQTHQTWDKIRISADGSAVWSTPVTLPVPPMGQPTTVTVDTRGGSHELSGHYYPFSHLGGGLLLFPRSPDAMTASLEMGVQTKIVTRSVDVP